MADKSPAIAALRLAGRLLPGDYLKTLVYRALVAKPRKALRLALSGFYRLEHVYDVLEEFTGRYAGRFSVLEFGTAAGYAFEKMLYATRYLGVEDRVSVHGFDTFGGMSAPVDPSDRDLVADDGWVEGQFQASYQELEDRCRARYRNYRLHPGRFEETLTPERLELLRAEPPILVWIDCDYYTSARVVVERLIPYLPSGCVIYFDDVDFNFRSRFSGEPRVIHEVNQGRFGDGYELVPDPRLALDSGRIYRFIDRDARIRYQPRRLRNQAGAARVAQDGSPFP